MPEEIPQTGNYRLNAERAVYNDLYGYLPVVSVIVKGQKVSKPEISRVSYLPVSEEEDSILRQQSFNSGIVNTRILYSRKIPYSYIDVIPLKYDSIRDRYLKLTDFDISYTTLAEKSILSGARVTTNGSSSVLASGEWYKIAVIKTGIHKIDRAYLQSMGIDVSGIDPGTIRIFGNGGKMLPQDNTETRAEDLIENPIYVEGDSDGSFDNNDYILFYGEDPHTHYFDLSGELIYNYNVYSDTTFYFLNYGMEQGLRIEAKENEGITFPEINQFDDYAVHETDRLNILSSGREWYGEELQGNNLGINFSLENIVPGSMLTMKSAILGKSTSNETVDIYVNGIYVQTQNIEAIQKGTYVIQGVDIVNRFSVDQTLINSTNAIDVQFDFSGGATLWSRAFLNYMYVTGKRELKFGTQNELIFRSLASITNAFSTFSIQNADSDIKIWDISDPRHPVIQEYDLDQNVVRFGAQTAGVLNEYIAFRGTEFPNPVAFHKIPNQNISASGVPDLLIISNKKFLQAANRLADHRSNHNGLRTLVVTPDQIYNEYSSGSQDVTALRDFIKDLYDRNGGENALKNVLLFGKGSYDYKDRTAYNTNYVPIYQSRNSLHPIQSYASDDYLGFLDDSEGEWPETYDGDHLMDVGVGRLPVKTIEEANKIVDKIIHYDTNPATLGNWRNEMVFIADDGDANIHINDAERLAISIDTAYADINVNKLYIDAYKQIPTKNGESSPDAILEFNNKIEKGVLIVNYTGHGSTTRWMDETILNISAINQMENYNRLPLFVTATCDFGRHDEPGIFSGAENLILSEKGGAIGLVTTSRAVFSSTNFILNKAFYKNVFSLTDGKHHDMGTIFMLTKNESLNGTSNRNFSLLADPSMTLAFPEQKIKLFAEEGYYKQGDTLNAQSLIKLKGAVLNPDESVNTSFSGSLQVTVYDKPSSARTYGDQSPPINFSVRNCLLFKGEVSVTEGEFDLEFVVPKNIDYRIEAGKISMYALDSACTLDAGGADIEFVVGGSNTDPADDTTPPEIVLFINDTSFVNGGITGPDIDVIAHLFDENGISISNAGIGQDLTIILDDADRYSVNEYYTSEKDTYKKGWLNYPLKDLSNGRHSIEVNVWDTYNNFNTATIEFLVVEDEHLAIEDLLNYPNPFRDETNFSFEHNRAGDDLEIFVDIYSVRGELVKQLYRVEENSPTRVTGLSWDGRGESGYKLGSGIYIFKVTIKSLIDGSKIQANQKLVIIN